MSTQEMIAQIIEFGTDAQFAELCRHAKLAGAPDSAVDDMVFHRQWLHNSDFKATVTREVRRAIDQETPCKS